MELDTSLNQAHFFVREAERQLKRGKFEEALSLQDKIVTLLELAKKDSCDNKISESLDLQIKHHIKQKVVITQRQSRCEKYTKDLKNLQIKMANANIQDAGLQVRYRHSSQTLFIFCDKYVVAYSLSFDLNAILVPAN